MGTDLHAALDAVIRFVEAEAPGVLGAIVRFEPDGVRARDVSAPRLPREFAEALDGRVIGVDAASSESATFAASGGRPTDIDTDPCWEGLRELARPLGLRGCWSSPIVSDEGTVLGGFAAFYSSARGPSAREIRLVEVATRVAAVVLAHGHAEAEGHEQSRGLSSRSRVVTLADLSGSLAHELNQPLTVILGNAQAARRLLRRQAPDLGEVDAGLRDIALAGRRASAVIERLRALVRAEPVRPTRLDVNEIAVVALDFARADLSARGIVLQTSLTPDLPLVLGDPIQLQQVVLNLTVNACDAMRSVESAERRLTIETRLSAAGDAVELDLSDGGSGIPDDALDRIFEPFYSRKPSGVGLGLAVCRSIVRAHGGRLSARNNPGGGATLHLVLPIAAERSQPGEGEG